MQAFTKNEPAGPTTSELVGECIPDLGITAKERSKRGGLEVLLVFGGPAAQSGLMPKDEIVRFTHHEIDEPISDKRSIENALRRERLRPPCYCYPGLKIWRGEQQMEISLIGIIHES